MKRLFSLLLVFAVLAGVSCSGTGEKQAEASPTAGSTAEPEAVTPDCAEPTPEPTATPEPTPRPRPTYPAAPKLGKLIDGPLFEEPIKYFVIDGESSLHYVYDAMGELVCTFSAPDYENIWGSGFFGEYGRPYDFDLHTMQQCEHYEFFEDFAFKLDYREADNDYGWASYLVEIRDADLENPIDLSNRDIEIGYLGSVLHIEGKYLVIKGSYEDMAPGEAGWHIDSEAILIDADGSIVGSVDPDAFGEIQGVFAGKYIIGRRPKEDPDPEDWEPNVYSIYTLGGELVMDDVKPITNSSYCPDDEIWESSVWSADYLTDADGVCYNGELEPLAKTPEDAATNAMLVKYGPIWTGSELRLYSNGVFYGICDEDWNWLFRIYNPRLASDYNNQRDWEAEHWAHGWDWGDD
ncbi:MAG: hypothetical protein IJM20_00535 [Clostridia bacterium]|nr:hypothetical protein [Clostridia bacterium]